MPQVHTGEDNFNGTLDDVLAGRTALAIDDGSSTGDAWAAGSVGSTAKIGNDNQLMPSTAAGNSYAYLNVTPATTEYDTWADFEVKALNATFSGVASHLATAADTLYYCAIANTLAYAVKRTAGSNSTVTVAHGLAAAGTGKLGIEVDSSGSDLIVNWYLQRSSDGKWLDSAAAWQSSKTAFRTLTDTSPHAKGFAGVMGNGAQTTTTGTRLNNWYFDDVVSALTAGTASAGTIASTTAQITWTNATGGTAPIAMQLQISAAGAGSWSDVSGATTSPGTATGLTASTSYDFRVRYTDSAGTPAVVYSNTVNITTSAPTATAYTFTRTDPCGPEDVASRNFTVTPNASYTGTITLTPSGGGLSTPIVLTFSASAAAQTFTITPTSPGTVTLTPTNNGGLANPSALTYESLVAVTNANLSFSANWESNVSSGSWAANNVRAGATAVQTTEALADLILSVTSAGSGSVTLGLDNTHLQGLSASTGPALVYRLNGGDWSAPIDIAYASSAHALQPIVTGLAAGTYHVEILHEGYDQTGGNPPDVWASPATAPYVGLKVLGVAVDSGSTLNAPSVPPGGNLHAFGDSFMAGSGNAANTFARASNRASLSWVRKFAAARGYRLAAVPKPGQGYSTGGLGGVPNFYHATPGSGGLGNYRAGSPRTGVPGAAVLIAHGLNGTTTAGTVTALIAQARALWAAPAKIGVLVPHNQDARAAITEGVEDYLAANPSDTLAKLIDPGVDLGLSALVWGSNGTKHLNGYGHELWAEHVGPAWDAAFATGEAGTPTYSRGRVVNCGS